MDVFTIVIFIGGLVLLVAGAEWLVRGASGLAGALGISPLVVGLTVVAFGTSAPELAVCITAALAGESDLALGNVVGSNIANILLILGMSAALAPLVVSTQVVRREVPLMVALSVGVMLLALDRQIGRVDGALLTVGVVLYVVVSIRASRREQAAEVTSGRAAATPAISARALTADGLRLVAGLGVLMFGTQGVVGGATAMAEAMGVSELLIGLTIVALGTSLPEGATSIVATIRGERDLAVGNAVGSNIFNLLAILGLTALVRPIGVPEAVLGFDLPIMIAVAIACLPVFFTGGEIARWEGLVFLGYYVAYVLYLVLDATNHGVLPAYRTMMVVFVAPLTGLTLAILAARHQLRRKEGTKERRNQG